MELHSNVKIAFTQKVISRMLRAFQAVSQQLDDRCFEIHSVARSKVDIMIPGLNSAGHILESINHNGLRMSSLFQYSSRYLQQRGN